MQQRKIDELEAQLNEAEDVITDLRSELKQVRDKLVKDKNSQLQCLNGDITKENTYSHNSMTVEAIIPSTGNLGLEGSTMSNIESTLLSERISEIRCSTSQQTESFGVSPKDIHENHNFKIASIIMRGKKPEEYRTGCTQRIRSFVGNLPDGTLPPLGDADSQDSVTQSQIEMNDKNTGTCVMSSPKTKSTGMAKNLSGEVARKPVKVHKLKKRKSRFGTGKAALRRCRRVQPTKLRPLSAVLSHCKTYSVNKNARAELSTCPLSSTNAVNMGVAINSNVLDELQHRSSSNEDKSVIIHKGKMEMRTQGSDAMAYSFTSSPDPLLNPSQPSSIISHNAVYAFAIRGTTKSSEDKLKIAENEAKMRPLPRLDPGVTLIRRGMNPVSGSKNVTVCAKTLNKPKVVHNDGDRELKKEPELVKQDGGSSQSPMVVCSKLRSEMVKLPVEQFDLKDEKLFSEINESPGKFRYTFQRKRKTLSTTSHEKSTVKRRSAEKQKDPTEPQSTLTNESSRDSWRLARLLVRFVVSFSGSYTLLNAS